MNEKKIDNFNEQSSENGGMSLKDIKGDFVKILKEKCHSMNITVADVENVDADDKYCHPVIDLGSGYRVKFQMDVERFQKCGWMYIYAGTIINSRGDKTYLDLYNPEKIWNFLQEFNIIYKKKFDEFFAKIAVLNTLKERMNNIERVMGEELFETKKADTELEFLKIVETAKNIVLEGI